MILGRDWVFLAIIIAGTLQIPLQAQSDTTPPQLTGLSFSTANVDVSASTQTFNVDATITDNLAGVGLCLMSFTSPSGLQVNDTAFSLTAGTSLNGTYRAVVTLPRFVQAGVWKASVILRDVLDNSSTVQSATLASLGFPSSLTVVDNTPDTQPPTLTGASFTPAFIDTSAGPQNVTVTLNVTDNLSGAYFSAPGLPTVLFVTLSTVGATASGPVQHINLTDFQLISGTNMNGVWSASKSMPRYSAAGPWQISSLSLVDAAGNLTSLLPAQLGINPVLTVSSAPSDSVPPLLTSLSLSSPIIDTSASSQNVGMTLSASDNLSGIVFTSDALNFDYIYVQFTSPSGGQNVFLSSLNTPPPEIAGSPLAGTWQLTAQWPKFSEQGTWNLNLLSLKDSAGNLAIYGPTQLKALGLPSSIVVTQPSLTSDGSVGPAGGTVSDNAFGTRATVTFPPGLVSGTTSVSIDVFLSPLSVPTPMGFTMPGTSFMNLAFSPALVSPLSAPGITVVIPLVNPMTVGAHLSLYHIDPVLGLSPALTASHTPVIGTVNADGISATFNNVATLSTVVAFISTGSVLGDVNGDGLVNCADVSLVESSFGKRTGQPGFNLAADLNADGIVDLKDLFIVNRQLPTGSVCN